MKFRRSALADYYLTGKAGIEIGGSAHNAFGLNTINVDRVHHEDPAFEPYRKEQMSICGAVMPVDVVAPGDALPFPDKSFDFVISSHVIEHFFDPISALKEWARVAREYIFIICPQRDALPSDRDKPLTDLSEHIARHEGRVSRLDTDEHHSRWTAKTFIEMCEHYNFEVCDWQRVDDKVGNGFTIVIQL